MAKTVNIGFVGCGANARGHIGALMGIDRAKIVAVCDLVKTQAAEAAQRTGASAYSQYAKMLERDDLHAVYLVLPVFAHGEPELAVTRRGLPFFVEKPVARTMEIAQEICGEVERQNLLTCAGYQLRYGPGTVAAQRLLMDQTIALIVGQYWSGSGRGPQVWQRQYAKSGGQILEQATHTLDMARFLCGEVKEVTAQRANRELKSIDCPDVCVANLTFASGAIGSMTTTWAYDPTDFSHANILHITFADKLLRWNSERSILHGGGAEATEHADGGRQIDEVFIDAVGSGDRSLILSPYQDAVKSLALSLAINESAETGQTVELD